MRTFKLTFLATIFLTLISCNRATRSNDKDTLQERSTNHELKQQQRPDSNADNLDFLKSLNGKYPNEVKLYDNVVLKKRLQKLLGDKYEFLNETFVMEYPIEIKDNIFTAGGCQPHNCASGNFLIAFDFLKNILYVGIRFDDVKVYSEDGSTCQQLIDWAKED